MDPFSLSLLSLGVSSMAIRRFVRNQSLEARVTASDPSTEPTRRLLMQTVFEISLRAGRGHPEAPARILAELARRDDHKGLVVDLDVPLSAVFELEGEGIEDVVPILARYRIAAVIYDATGVAQCALSHANGRPTPRMARMFALGGLPLLALASDGDCADGMARIEAAFVPRAPRRPMPRAA